MLTASPELIAFLASGNRAFVAELVTLDLERPWGVNAAQGISAWAGGTRCKWTSAQLDVAGFAAAIPMAVGGVARAVGIEVTETELSLLSGEWAFPNGVRLPLAAARGAFDGAHVKVERLFMETWGDTSLGTINWFEGTVSDVEPSSLGVRLTLKDDRERLNLPLPRRVFQPACPYELYGPACGVAKTVGTTCWNRTILAAPAPTASAFALGSIGGDADAFKLGTVAFTSGELAGLTAMIEANTAPSGGVSTFTLFTPLPSVPAAGTACTIYWGCDKSHAMCNARFANLRRFGGFPHVPRPESVR